MVEPTSPAQVMADVKIEPMLESKVVMVTAAASKSPPFYLKSHEYFDCLADETKQDQTEQVENGRRHEELRYSSEIPGGKLHHTIHVSAAPPPDGRTHRAQ